MKFTIEFSVSDRLMEKALSNSRNKKVFAQILEKVQAGVKISMRKALIKAFIKELKRHDKVVPPELQKDVEKLVDNSLPPLSNENNPT